MESVDVAIRYYSMIFMNQMVFLKEDTELATTMIKIYFGLFKTTAEKKGDIDPKMMDAILTGIHRAFPYAPFESKM